MSEGVVSPVLLRPLFDQLGLVTCRTFETLAANTIPLLVQDRDYVADVYGPHAAELILPANDQSERILNIFSDPERYAAAVMSIRRHLAEKHSYTVRIRELIDIIES
jgi:hypothetical protein